MFSFIPNLVRYSLGVGGLLLVASACEQSGPTDQTELSTAQEAAAGGVYSGAPDAGPAGVMAPVVSDGNVAGAVTEIVLNLGVDLDPNVPGWSLATGEAITVTLPDGWINTGLPIQDVATPGCAPGGLTCSTAVILQGWPQHPIGAPPPNIKTVYSMTQGATSNTLVITALQDINPNTPLEPGIKQIHLIFQGFLNPKPGMYSIAIQSDGGQSVSAPVHVIPKTRPSVNVTSVLNPGTPNTIYQYTTPNAYAPLSHAFYLWDRRDDAMLGVTIEMVNADHALMRQEGGGVVGHVFIEAPPGSTGQAVESVGPSSPANSFLIGQPTALLEARFRAGSATGEYLVHYTMNGGNTATMVVRVD